MIKTAQGAAYVQDVKFDVAVTASDEQGAKAGAGIKILGATLGADGKVNYQNSEVSRVQFSVPVVWPGQTQPELESALKQQRQRDGQKFSAPQGGSGSPHGWMKY